MRELKIGYFAHGLWGQKAFELLHEDRSIDICFIVPRKNIRDDPLKTCAEKNGIDFLHSVNVNTPEFRQKAREYHCDLFVSMSYNQIIGSQTLALPEIGSINCHAGKLPFYRGRSVLNWALINGEEEFGITVHFINEEIDKGDIILQKTYPITEEDDYGSVLAVAQEECAKLLYQAVKKIQNNNYNRVSQEKIHPEGSYFRRRKEGDEIIDWDQTSRDLFNFIRALADPGPRATTFLEGEPVKINKAKVPEGAASPDATAKPGKILEETESGYVVKTRDMFLEITEIESDAELTVGKRFEDI